MYVYSSSSCGWNEQLNTNQQQNEGEKKHKLKLFWEGAYERAESQVILQRLLSLGK